MTPVRRVDGPGIVLWHPDIDTDQIVPKQFLTRLSRSGWGEHLFHDWRRREDLPFDDPARHDAVVLVAGPNFGCGSSREQAVWALQQWGIDAVVAPGFAPIFEENCGRAGLLAVQLPERDCRSLARALVDTPRTTIHIDVAEQRLQAAGLSFEFPLAPRARHALLTGEDEIEQSLRLLAAAEPYQPMPWFPSLARLTPEEPS